MKQIFLVVLSMLSLSAPAMAASGSDRAILSLGGMVPIIGGAMNVGGAFEFAFRPAPSTGFYLGLSGSGFVPLQSGGATAMMIPFGLSMRFQAGSGAVKPYLAIEGGGAYATVSVLGFSVSTITYSVFARPGIRLGVFYIEPRVGLIGSTLVIAPTAGLTFSL